MVDGLPRMNTQPHGSTPGSFYQKNGLEASERNMIQAVTGISSSPMMRHAIMTTALASTMHGSSHVCMYVCMFVSMYVCINVCLSLSLSIFLFSSISVPPICLDPAASCVVNKRNKEGLIADTTNMTVREEDVHDHDPVRQGHVSASPFTPFAVARESFAGQLCLLSALTHGRFASSLCLCLCLPRERRRPNSTGTHTSIWSRTFLRLQADLVHMPGNSKTTYCEMLTTHQ